MTKRYNGVAWIVALCLIAGCQTAYYGTMEKFGIHKRDILVDRIEDARDDQEATKEQFQSALEQFSAVTSFDGGSLEKYYKQLDAALKRSEAHAADVHASIQAVEDVAGALFVEWETELKQYQSDSLRRQSAQQLSDTRVRYGKLIRAMHNAEDKIDPVLGPFRDQVLFLKHNLNAQAIASLQNQLITIESDVSVLVKEMEVSIDEANEFIGSL